MVSFFGKVLGVLPATLLKRTASGLLKLCIVLQESYSEEHKVFH